jgi:hypothetical protein
MKIGAWKNCVALLALIGVGSSPALAEDAELVAALRQVVVDNVAAYDREDVAATMGTIATKSPNYDTTQTELAAQFTDLEVKPEVVGFQFVGHDDEFAVARVKIKTVATPKDAGFTDNTVDAILIFHQDGGVWKLWADEILGVELHP